MRRRLGNALLWFQVVESLVKDLVRTCKSSAGMPKQTVPSVPPPHDPLAVDVDPAFDLRAVPPALVEQPLRAGESNAAPVPLIEHPLPGITFGPPKRPGYEPNPQIMQPANTPPRTTPSDYLKSICPACFAHDTTPQLQSSP